MESGPAYASPVLMSVDGTKVVIAPTDGGRNQGSWWRMAATDGKLLWEIPYSEVRYIATTPIVDGSTLIIAGPGTGMTAFKMKKEGDKLVEEKLWSNTDNSVGFNTPVLKDGLVFGLTGADQLFCLNTQSQKTAWSAPFGKPAAAEKTDAKDAAGESNARPTRSSIRPVRSAGSTKAGGREQSDDQPDEAPRSRRRPRHSVRVAAPADAVAECAAAWAEAATARSSTSAPPCSASLPPANSSPSNLKAKRSKNWPATKSLKAARTRTLFLPETESTSRTKIR